MVFVIGTQTRRKKELHGFDSCFLWSKITRRGAKAPVMTRRKNRIIATVLNVFAPSDLRDIGLSRIFISLGCSARQLLSKELRLFVGVVVV
ncbi:hypothetical protein OZX57_00520 [Bifidobacterium sp. ESL0682]|uniref:hypothetical protein n=1 Tax=Bifidobacterium sp. ESL0682 TaxID=2983212 RepID=UPI0023F7C663|nr:hypothetical protein [Bifidobacterium sp. ESL0682]WEV42043.1 hypothetical protein OZX57_00520 [Bifidobacterium sp. ESL0682]